MPIIKKGLGLFALTSLIAGCSSHEQKQPYGAPAGMEINAQTPVDFLTVYYYSLNTCLHCHENRQSPFLSTYAAIKAHIADIQDVVKDGHMPPQEDGYKPLDACQKLLLDRWVAAGMPAENGALLGQSCP